jgi:hypothetical protein
MLYLGEVHRTRRDPLKFRLALKPLRERLRRFGGAALMCAIAAQQRRRLRQSVQPCRSLFAFSGPSSRASVVGRAVLRLPAAV